MNGKILQTDYQCLFFISVKNNNIDLILICKIFYPKIIFFSVKKSYKTLKTCCKEEGGRGVIKQNIVLKLYLETVLKLKTEF